MKAADYISKYIEHRGVGHVFELVGGMITFLLDSLHQQTKIEIVSMHHEQAAGFAAEGYGRITGVPGVAMATSGPGATNLLTAIGSCYFDSTPAVFITGQVNRHEQKGDRAIRQLGFQETDIVAMARPVTKAAWLVNDPDDLPRLLEEAFDLASSGRPGPVLIDVPMDVQRAEITDISRLDNLRPQKAVEVAANPKAVEFWGAFKKDLAAAKRPLILAGGGIRSSLTAGSFRELTRSLGIPVAYSLMAVDVLPSDDPLRVGLIGSYGNRWANIALAESDLLLVLGSRLDVRQTGADTDGFKEGRTIYHVDCEAGEMNNRVSGCRVLVSELDTFIEHAIAEPPMSSTISEWKTRIAELKSHWPDTAEFRDGTGINPNELMHRLSDVSKAAVAYVLDVGQHQMWGAQSLDLASHQRLLTSGGMGAMGFALPAAIGACLGARNKPVVVVAGDGGIQLNIQELQTIFRLQLPIKIIVINNKCHGMVRQFQESYFHGRYQSTLWGYSTPSFKKLAEAYEITSAFVEDTAELATALELCWENPQAPFLLEVGIATETNAYPKMAFGLPMSQMEPLAKPVEMEGT
jgi:acetolactate synthase-1/2/3 large subunit